MRDRWLAMPSLPVDTCLHSHWFPAIDFRVRSLTTIVQISLVLLLVTLFQQNARAQDSPLPTTRVLVKAYKITGTSVIAAAELESIVAPYVGREMDLTELEKVAYVVTTALRDKGYSLARAYIPAQEIKDGNLEIAVLEGKVGEIIVRGNQNYSSEFIKRGFTAVVRDGAVKQSSLEKSLLVLNEYPDLKATAVLEAGK